MRDLLLDNRRTFGLYLPRLSFDERWVFHCLRHCHPPQFFRNAFLCCQFHDQAKQQQPVTTSISTLPPTLGTPTPAEPSGGVPVGAIVGGVIGGLGLIALVSFGLFFFCFRHKKRPTTGAVDYSGGSRPPPPVVQSQLFSTNNDVGLSPSPAFRGPNIQEAKLTDNTGSRLSTTSPVPPYTPQIQQ
ncbi:hypothetical protein V8F33_003724 [Rhypophila sp. PSN 637]